MMWETLMQPQLPAVLNRYFAAQNTHDVDAMVACFAPDAAVRDEGEDIVGTDAIRAWKQETSAKYRITAEPLDCRVEGDRTIVVARVSGTFPGSPADLTYRFGLAEDGRIGTLEVG
jgi:uncharacterized protein (TIGR02246 family)